MKEILKLQYSYLFNKVSAWFLFIMLVILTVGILYASGFNYSYGELDLEHQMRRQIFQAETLMLVKFTLVATTVFISIQGYYSQFCKYHLFFLQKPNGKLQLGIAKQIAIIAIQLLIIIHSGLIIHIVGFYLTPYFEFEAHYLIALISVLIEAMTLGVLGSIFVQILDSIFSGLVPMFLFWTVEANASYDEIIQSKLYKILYAFISNPVIYQNKYILIYDMTHYLLIFISLWFFNLLIFLWNDMK